ncbi:MAG: hypothetical protein OD918_05330 [Gammaproteobacteria bacterium]
MKLYGYSERGMLNALLYEIQRAENADTLFNQLVAAAVFPLTDDNPAAGPVNVLIEQSLSGFGDADAIALISSPAGGCAIFIEAKVKTSQASDWALSKEFDAFEKGIEKKKVNSSNLFTQIYHKQRMMSALKSAGIAGLQRGVTFPEWSSNQNRKIGDNAVVLRAVERIRWHVGGDFYLMLIPDNGKRAERFFRDTLRHKKLASVPQWDASHCGYLTWEKTRAFCEQHELKTSLEVFEYNDGQIFQA